MLNAAEAAMDETAEDDAERQRNRARLYAPPPGERRRSAERPAGAGMTRAQASALTAQLEAEDARLNGRRG
ncbi:hypothetical protein GCM10010207_84920 [Streptomyces atratus]|nr:hypothetical protein GCM10010207_84920 [Streptomyces atratus]